MWHMLQKQSENSSILRWFFISFILYTMVVIIALIPILVYSRQMIVELETAKITQNLENGIRQLESHASNAINAAYSFMQDSDFSILFYKTKLPDRLTPEVRQRMQRKLSNINAPLSLVADAALVMDESSAVCTNRTVFNERYNFYPDRFCNAER